jgi:hypothetical protein
MCTTELLRRASAARNWGSLVFWFTAGVALGAETPTHDQPSTKGILTGPRAEEMEVVALGKSSSFCSPIADVCDRPLAAAGRLQHR